MRFALTGLLLAALALGAGSSPARAQPAEYLPASHTLYEDLEALVARGLVRSASLHTRPMARVDIARALQEARLALPAIESDLHFRRLERELARELAEVGVAPEARETGPLLDVGARDQRFR
ncbi:MAG: hypothetical protein E6K77_04295, partial [Candidatus Eisenbacteria bacterium]